MSTIAPRDRDNDVAADERFVELLCADDDLVRAEFDAIIAAEFASPTPPPDPDSAAEPAAGKPPARSRRDVRGAAPATRPRHPLGRRGRRQRSPPSEAMAPQVA